MSWPSNCGSNANKVKALLDAKADVNAKGGYRRTALNECVRYDHIDCVKLLLEYGADRHCQDMWGNTPFYHARDVIHKWEEEPKKIILDILTNWTPDQCREDRLKRERGGSEKSQAESQPSPTPPPPKTHPSASSADVEELLSSALSKLGLTLEQLRAASPEELQGMFEEEKVSFKDRIIIKAALR